MERTRDIEALSNAAMWTSEFVRAWAIALKNTPSSRLYIDILDTLA